jgi:hypothetical protein
LDCLHLSFLFFWPMYMAMHFKAGHLGEANQSKSDIQALTVSHNTLWRKMSV